tara:strand:- start:87446 stop:87877 length:432 start_codon:yes stop_codon:yes gene_type:complete
MWNRLFASAGVLLLLTSVVLGQLPHGHETADPLTENLRVGDASERPAARFTHALLFQQAPSPIEIAPTLDTPVVDEFDQDLRLAGIGVDENGPICWIATGEAEAVALRVGDRFLAYEVVEIGDGEVQLRAPGRTEALRLFSGH